MRRISVEDIREAYKRTGLKPVRGTTTFLGRAKRFNEGCPIDALIFGMLGERFCALDVAAALDVSLGYLEGFILGVDGAKSCSEPNHYQGLCDGRAVAAAIFGQVQA